MQFCTRVMYSSEKRMGYTDTIGQRRTTSFLAFAIIATIATIIICLVVLVLRKRIKLVIALFKEAGKALGNMPLLLLEPILVNGSIDIFFFYHIVNKSICRLSLHWSRSSDCGYIWPFGSKVPVNWKLKIILRLNMWKMLQWRLHDGIICWHYFGWPNLLSGVNTLS